MKPPNIPFAGHKATSRLIPPIGVKIDIRRERLNWKLAQRRHKTIEDLRGARGRPAMLGQNLLRVFD